MSVVAIVGRPNVGKSTIFNILTASRSAIVADYSGLTRDRKYGNLKDSHITLIDTGGLNEESDDMSHAIKEQTDLAIDEADSLLFVVDAIDGYTVVNLSVGIEYPDNYPINKLDLILLNASDKDGVNSSRTVVFGVAATGIELIAPRQFMVRLSKNF